MDWPTITAFVGAIGGLEFVKWWANRKAYARREDASAKDAELTLHEKQIERYEARLSTRDMKVDTLYRELRDAQLQVLTLQQAVGERDLKIALLEHQKCERRRCENRVPPGEY